MKLKPCPFCGGEALIDTDVFGDYVICKKCLCQTATHSTEEQSEKAWNTRHTERRLAEAVVEKGIWTNGLLYRCNECLNSAEEYDEIKHDENCIVKEAEEYAQE